MATLEQIAAALRKADAAGNVEDARALANAYRQMQSQQTQAAAPADTFNPMTDLPLPGTSNPGVPDNRYRSPIPGADMLNEFASSFAENIPILGPATTRAADTAGSQIAAMLSGGTPQQELAEGQAMRARDREENPVASTAGAVTGSVGPLMALGATQAGGQLLGTSGPLLQRVLAGMGSGSVLAGGDSFARGNDAGQVARDTALGGGLGLAFPLAERAISPVLRALMGQSVSAPVQSLARNLERDNIDPASITARLNAIGPEAVPMDLGPNMARQAGAIASLPGEGQTVLRDALVARNAGTNARIQGGVNNALGPATSPRAFEAGIADAKSQLSPIYEQALSNSKAVDTAPIALNLESAAVNLRGEAQNVASSLRGMLDVAGNPGYLDPNPRTLFEVRKAIDGMFSTVQDGNARRLLTETRRLVDDELASKVPGIKAADAEYKKLAESSSAFEQGQQALDSGRSALTPSDLSTVAATSPAHVLDAMSQGTRAEIDRLIGTTANNITALKSAVKGDGSWNRDRLAMLFGAKKADDLLNILEREQTYQRGYNTVTQNSETAARTAAQKEAAPHQFGSTTTSIADLLLKIPQGLANAGARGRSESLNRQIAELLMSRPSPDLVEQLLLAQRGNRGVLGSSAVPMLTNQ